MAAVGIVRLVGAAVVVGAMSAAVPVGAGEVTVTGCPTAAAGWQGADVAYPPFPDPIPEEGFPQPEALPQRAFVGCEGSVVGFPGGLDVAAWLGFPGLPVEDCASVVALRLHVGGEPADGGWGIIAWDAEGGSPVPLASGGGPGTFQRYGAQVGDVWSLDGLDLVAEVDQPEREGSGSQGSNAYQVAVELDPGVLDPAALAEGRLGVTVLDLDPGIDLRFMDVAGPLTAEVVVDDAACAVAGTAAPTTTTTAAPPAPVPAAPRFTG